MTAALLLIVALIVLSMALWTYVPAFDPFRHDGHRLRRRDAVALTFDDELDPDLTRGVLGALAHAGVLATFFVTGERAMRSPGIVREIVRRGHQVGCAGWSHHRFGWRRLRRIEEAVSSGFRQLTEIMGVPPTVFRAPQGTRSPWLYGATRRRAMHSVAWSLRMRDRDVGDPQAFSRRVLHRVRGGDIVVLPSAAAEALPAVLEGLADRALTPIALSADTPLEPSRLGLAVRLACGVSVALLVTKLVLAPLTLGALAEAVRAINPSWLGMAAGLALITTVVRARQVAFWSDAPSRHAATSRILEGTGLALTAGLVAPPPWPAVTATTSAVVALALRARAPRLTMTALLCAGRWLLEVAVLVTAARAANIALDPLQGALCVPVIILVMAVPLVPANIGILEAALASMFERFGSAPSAAFAGAVIYHLVDLLPSTLIGVAALPFLSRYDGGQRRDRARVAKDDAWSPPILEEIAARTAAFATLLAHGAFLPRRRRDLRGSLTRALAWMGPDMGLIAAFSPAVTPLLWMMVARRASAAPLLWLGGGTLASLGGVAAWRSRRILASGRTEALNALAATIRRTTRDCLPVVLLTAIYSLNGSASLGRHPVVDLLLWGACLLQLLTTSALLLAQRRRDSFRELIAAIVVVTCGGFLVDSLLSARAPLHFAGCAPIALATVGVLGAWMRRRILHASLVLQLSPAVLGIILCATTIYLRDLRVGDGLAGMALGAGGYWINDALVSRWPRRRNKAPQRSRSRLAA